MVAELSGDVLQLFGVVPDLIEEVEVSGGEGLLIQLVDHIRNGIAGLVAEVNGGEAVERHVDGFGLGSLDTGKLLHGGGTAIGAEAGFAPDPGGAFLGDGSLGELIFKADLEVGAVEAALAVEFRDVELAALFAAGVGHERGEEGWGGEDEMEGIDGFELLL